MKLVTISGLDGSGKSTQINSLRVYLESQGQRVFYFHAIEFGIANKMTGVFNYCHPEQSRGISSENNEIATVATLPRNDKQKSVHKSGWLGIFLRKIALRIDLARFKLLRNKLRNNGYDYILSDRYFYDTVINVEYLKNSSLQLKQKPPRKLLLRNFPLLQRWLIKPSIAIYLQADPEEIMSRERVPDQGLEYLQGKKKLYDQAAEIFGMKIIDGNRNKEAIFSEIKSLAVNKQ